MLKLQCTKRFSEGGLVVHEGVHVFTDALGNYLRDNFPAFFVEWVEPVVAVAQDEPSPADEPAQQADEPAEPAPATKDVEAPQVDKMVKRPRGRK